MPNAPLFRGVVLWFLIVAIGLPPTPAAAGGRSQWERVIALKANTHLMVAIVAPPATAAFPGANPRVLEGWLAWADASCLVLQHIEGDWTQSGTTSTRSGDVEIPRERVVEVTVVKERRPWWAIPLVVAAVAGGIVLCIGALEALADGSTWPEGDDTNCGPLAVFAAPFVMGGWADRKTDRPVRSEKVIYRAPRPAGQAGQ